MPPKRSASSPTRASPRPTPKRAPSPKSPKRAKSPAAAAPSPPSSALAAAAPSSHETSFEFGGPAGALGIMLSLPLFVAGLFYACGAGGCVVAPTSDALATLQRAYAAHTLWSWRAAAIVVGWTLVQFVLYVALPGPVVEGTQLADGTRLKYPINGHLAFWLSLTAPFALNVAFPSLGIDLSYLYDHYLELATASAALSLVVSVYTYASSFVGEQLLAAGGQSGNALYDFFIGRPLNPRVGRLDLKTCCELRPGIIGWAMLLLGMASKQAAILGHVSAPMLCVCACQLLYVWDSLHHEKAILTTMDITTDGFGFMLAFGDLTWVPFTYSLQARILVDHDPALPAAALAAVCVLNALGYLVFRGANSQKDAFRSDPTAPEVGHLDFMQTKRGTKLLVSGFWGMARKINYTGDWLMGLSWSLFCGFISPVAYFYPIYFLVLLVHRAWRDDHFCSIKYGADWASYKQRVPYVFVPGVF